MTVLNRYWLILATVFVLSVCINYFASENVVTQTVALLPASGSLLGALWLAFRDHVAHERRRELQDQQNSFTLGAMSHVADVVFDKHVEFCEKYLNEVHETVSTFTREGPTDAALRHAGNLVKLRIEYAAWLTPEMESNLEPFEKAIRKIGAKSGLAESLGKSLRERAVLDADDRQRNEKIRSEAIDEMHQIFLELMGLDDEETKDEHTTVKVVMERVREILQINELVYIRTNLIKKAHKL